MTRPGDSTRRLRSATSISIGLFLIFWLPVLAAAGLQAQKPLAFTHVTVIDCTGAKPKADRTVAITGNRISALGRSGRVKVPADAQVVDATGKFLIPGLWDMHIHGASVESLLSLYVANGILGIRDMGSPQAQPTQQLRQEIAEGRRLGPRIVMGLMVDGPKTSAAFRPCDP